MLERFVLSFTNEDAGTYGPRLCTTGWVWRQPLNSSELSFIWKKMLFL